MAGAKKGENSGALRVAELGKRNNQGTPNTSEKDYLSEDRSEHRATVTRCQSSERVNIVAGD